VFCLPIRTERLFDKTVIEMLFGISDIPIHTDDQALLDSFSVRGEHSARLKNDSCQIQDYI
jgi:hypothetical protein